MWIWVILARMVGIWWEFGGNGVGVQVKFGWALTEMTFWPNSYHSYHLTQNPPGFGQNQWGRVKYSLFGLLSIISLHHPSTHRLLAFCFNIACIWYSEPQHRISDLFGLLSIVSLHCPSTHHLLAFHLLLVFNSASLNLFLIYLIYSWLSLSLSFYPSSFCHFALLVFDTAISLSWAPTQIASLRNTLCLLSIHALVATVFCSSFEQDHPRIFLDCSIPPNLFWFGYFKAHSTEIKRCSIWITLHFCNSSHLCYLLHSNFYGYTTCSSVYLIPWGSLPSIVCIGYNESHYPLPQHHL